MTTQVCTACQQPFIKCLCAYWCRWCGSYTNHKTMWHEEAMRDQPQEPTR